MENFQSTELIHYGNFREFLKRQFQMKRAKNSRYSLRAFARDLDIGAPHLNRYLKKQKGISILKAESILSLFPLQPLQRKFLLSSVLLEHARSSIEKDRGQKELDRVNLTQYHALDEAEFSQIHEWYHIAILVLMELPTFQYDLEWIANQLQISSEVVAVAIARMINLGMIKKSGDIIERNASYVCFSNAPNEALRSFHSQIADKTRAAVEQLDSNERASSSFFLSVKESQFEEAKAFIKEFSVAFANRFSTQIPKGERDSIYVLNANFFKLCNTVLQHENREREESRSGTDD